MCSKIWRQGINMQSRAASVVFINTHTKKRNTCKSFERIMALIVFKGV